MWHDLIVALQKNQLRHKDLVVACFVCFFWKLLGGREISSITVPKAKVKILTRIPAPTFKASLGRLRAVTLLNFKDKHKYGFEITKWAGGPDVRQAGVSQSTSTPDFIPPTAILNIGMESMSGRSNNVDGEGRIVAQEGDRGIKSLQPAGVDRCPSHVRVAAKSDGGRGSNECQN